MTNALGERTAEPLTVIDYDPEWPVRFAELGGRLRSALGDVALRIDHIGSTAVPGLVAKPSATSASGRATDGRTSTCAGPAPSQEHSALLFRDYLRAHPDAAAKYGLRKRGLADLLATDRHGYTNAKAPIIWHIIQQADEWAQRTGWEPPPSDA